MVMGGAGRGGARSASTVASARRRRRRSCRAPSQNRRQNPTAGDAGGGPACDGEVDLRWHKSSRPTGRHRRAAAVAACSVERQNPLHGRGATVAVTARDHPTPPSTSWATTIAAERRRGPVLTHLLPAHHRLRRRLLAPRLRRRARRDRGRSVPRLRPSISARYCGWQVVARRGVRGAREVDEAAGASGSGRTRRTMSDGAAGLAVRRAQRLWSPARPRRPQQPRKLW